MRNQKINLSKLSTEQRKKFVKGYSLLIQKWKKEFKLSFLERILSFYSRAIQNFILKKDSKTYFEESIKKRKELIQFANNNAEKEIIQCWINMDRETIKWKDYIIKINLLQLKQKGLVDNLFNNKNFESAKKLFENQMKLMSQWKILEKSTLYKARQQEKIKNLGKQLSNVNGKKEDVILLGIITDILSKNQNLVGTQASLVYSLAKNYKPNIINSILLTKKLKENSIKNQNRIKIILKDLESLFREINKNGK